MCNTTESLLNLYSLAFHLTSTCFRWSYNSFFFFIRMLSFWKNAPISINFYYCWKGLILLVVLFQFHYDLKGHVCLTVFFLAPLFFYFINFNFLKIDEFWILYEGTHSTTCKMSDRILQGQLFFFFFSFTGHFKKRLLYAKMGNIDNNTIQN